MKVSKEVAQKLRKVCEQITLEPELYDQDKYRSDKNPCNSACCIGGWLVWNDDPDKFEKLTPREISLRAQEIVPSSGSIFFLADVWAEPFRSRYLNTKSKKQRAKVACDRIEFFIKEGR